MDFQFVHFWISTLNNVTLVAVLSFLLSVILVAIINRVKYVQNVNRIPGSRGSWPLLGDVPILLVPAEEIFERMLGYINVFRSDGPVVRCWVGPLPMFFLFTVEAFEVVLSSSKLIEKSREYNFIRPWLSNGLLTSRGNKWFTRRKLLTQTFHFKILEDFLHVFNEQSQTLVEKLNQTIVNDGNSFDIYPYITRCTLDIICESAMGCKIQAQTDIDGEYVRAVYSMCRIIQSRIIRPWLQPDFLFRLSFVGGEQRRCLNVLHNFTDQVIRNRKLERKQQEIERKDGVISSTQENESIPKKKRLAFLDLLIDASDEGKLLSDLDIREEVDTFMFEGHDTTTAAVNWSLLLIGHDSHVQGRINEELLTVFGDSNRPVTVADLSELKYLECCIKEALRLYPSVPMIGRQFCEDTVIHGYTIPAKASVFLFPYILHRDPKNFSDPELFQPERFLGENGNGRHPYAYVPFSAGPRNCIGRKFALMEEKVILSSIFRNFHLKSLDKREELTIMNDVILRPHGGIRLQLTPKTKSSC